MTSSLPKTFQHAGGDDPSFAAVPPEAATDAASAFRLLYMTDIEGNLDYFLRCVRHQEDNNNNNGVLSYDQGQLDLVNPSTDHFVYGGDVVDKGDGDIRLCRMLVALKQRYPNNVELLVGNRDLNKLRLSAELDEVGNRHYQDIPGPHWDTNAPTLQQYLTSLADSSSSTTTDNNLQALDTRVNRLQYMLRHTLGCPDTFEFRRRELQILQTAGGDDATDMDGNETGTTDRTIITDEQVVDSFLHEIEHGSLWQYLNLAKVAVLIGNTFFCHGAVDRHTMRFIPDITTRFHHPQAPGPGVHVDSVIDWIDGLNQLLQHGLADYQQRPYWNENRTSRGGEALMALQNRSAMWGRSIISNCYGDGGCITTRHAPRLVHDTHDEFDNDNDGTGTAVKDPLAFEGVCSDPADPVVAEWLRRHGIQRVVVGHKPTADCPAVLSARCHAATTTTASGNNNGGLEIVSADTSYSDPTAPDNRGLAVSVVTIVGASRVDNHLECSGTLHDGTSHHSVFARLSVIDGIDESVGDARLGTTWSQHPHDDDDWWVKALLLTPPSPPLTTMTGAPADQYDQKWYHLTRGKGRHVEYRRATIPNTESSE
jgi:hypothetical protein